MTIATLDGLLAAIIDDPDDDDLRLIYADLADEMGRDLHAELIRVQVELAKIDPAEPCGGYFCDWEPDDDDASDGYWRHIDCRAEVLRRREVELIPQQIAPHPVVYCEGWSYRRGFVESVTCSVGGWLEHGPAIARATPLARVTLSGLVPSQSPPGLDPPCYRWDVGHYESLAFLDDYFHSLGVWLPTADKCLRRLSAALIAWAKAQSVPP